MARLRYNLLDTALGGPLTNVATTITFTTALQEFGTNIPTIAAPDYLPLTLDRTEVVWLTAYTSGATTGTIQRAPSGESSVGVAHLSGVLVENCPTKQDVAASVLSGWFRDNVAISLSAVALSLANARTEIPMPSAGHVVGIVVYSNAARSAGTLTVDATIDGTVTGLTAVLDGSNTQTKATRQAQDLDKFVAGGRIGVKITTDGSWAPTTADIDVAVLVVPEVTP